MKTIRTQQTVHALTYDCMPRVLPPDWEIVSQSIDTSSCLHFKSKKKGLLVVLSASPERDGRDWLHVSVSHRDRIPNWEEFLFVKDLFVGRDRQAIQVFPPSVEYVNFCVRALHLWCCLTERVIPDFRIDGMI